MAEGTYEYECNRAELLGLEPPDKDAFEAARKAQQEEEQQNEMLNELSIQDEQVNSTSGKFDELNSILSVTQQKINKFKQACGSLTNLLKIRPNQETGLDTNTENKDKLDGENEVPQSAAAGVNTIDSITSGSGSLNNALDNLEAMKMANEESNISVLKKSSMDMQQKMSCQFGKLDALLSKAENAEYSMANQTKDMKRIIK